MNKLVVRQYSVPVAVGTLTLVTGFLFWNAIVGTAKADVIVGGAGMDDIYGGAGQVGAEFRWTMRTTSSCRAVQATT